MTSTPLVQTPAAAAEQAKALLAYAADERHFYEAYVDDGHRTLFERDAATALYAAQAATAHAMLAVAGELAELRAEVRRVAVVRQDLADVAAAVRELAEAVTTSGMDVTEQVADLTITLSNKVSAGLADVATEVADVSAAIDDRGPSGRERRRLWWPWRRRAVIERTEAQPGHAAKASPVDADVMVALAVPALPAGREALERLSHLEEHLRAMSVLLPDALNMSGLRQGLAALLAEAWEATAAVIAQVRELAADTTVDGRVTDARLLLESALDAMGPAGMPSTTVVMTVHDRLIEVLKTVAAATVRTEVRA